MKLAAVTAAFFVLLSAHAVACGRERWAVKTLTDPAAKQVNFRPIAASVCALNALPAEQTSFATPRLPAEKRSYRVTAVVVKYKLEADQDIHLVLEEGGCQMIAESPDLACTHGAQARWRMLQARRRIEAMGAPSDRWRYINRTMTVTGVLFFDVPHGQTGIADNAVELHPITGLSG